MVLLAISTFKYNLTKGKNKKINMKVPEAQWHKNSSILTGVYTPKGENLEATTRQSNTIEIELLIW